MYIAYFKKCKRDVGDFHPDLSVTSPSADFVLLGELHFVTIILNDNDDYFLAFSVITNFRIFVDIILYLFN